MRRPGHLQAFPDHVAANDETLWRAVFSDGIQHANHSALAKEVGQPRAGI